MIYKMISALREINNKNQCVKKYKLVWSIEN